jgi:diaminopimelate decarboxylase
MSLTYRDLARLEAAHGSAFYLYDRTRLTRNYTEFLTALRACYPNTSLAYSYKANYLPEICRAVQEMRGYAEVVSIMEYELAIRLGVEPEMIIFNGPLKEAAHLLRALGDGATVNVESSYEVASIEALARGPLQTPFKIGIRCNVAGAAATTSRFGFDISRPAFGDAVARLRAIPRCNLGGLHCHVMPPRRSADEFRAIAGAMLDVARDVFGDRPPRFINLGGGFFSREVPQFHQQFGLPVPTPQQYAEALAGPFAAAYPDGTPELILEPGMALVADTMRFVTRVVDVKVVQATTFAQVSSSVYNIVPGKSGRYLPFERIPAPGGAAQHHGPVDIVGYTCMEDDVLVRGYDGPIAAGDYLVFQNVGAYSIVLKPPFGLPAPPVLSGEGKGDPLRRAETFDDVFATYPVALGQYEPG